MQLEDGWGGGEEPCEGQGSQFIDPGVWEGVANRGRGVIASGERWPGGVAGSRSQRDGEHIYRVGEETLLVRAGGGRQRGCQSLEIQQLGEEMPRPWAGEVQVGGGVRSAGRSHWYGRFF